jgi:hypothetical protein
MQAPSHEGRQEVRLVEAPFPFSDPVKWHGQNGIDAGVPEKGDGALGHEAPQMTSQGHPPPMLEKQEHFPEGIVTCIEGGRPGEEILGRPGPTGLTPVRCGRGVHASPEGTAAPWTKGGLEHLDPPPAGATDHGPGSYAERAPADGALGWKDEPKEGKGEFQAPAREGGEPHLQSPEERSLHGADPVSSRSAGETSLGGGNAFLALFLLLACDAVLGEGQGL